MLMGADHVSAASESAAAAAPPADSSLPDSVVAIISNNESRSSTKSATENLGAATAPMHFRRASNSSSNSNGNASRHDRRSGVFTPATSIAIVSGRSRSEGQQPASTLLMLSSTNGPADNDEHVHRSGHTQSWLRAMTLGAMDGVGSIASLVLGVEGGNASRHGVILAGVSGTGVQREDWIRHG